MNFNMINFEYKILVKRDLGKLEDLCFGVESSRNTTHD